MSTSDAGGWPGGWRGIPKIQDVVRFADFKLRGGYAAARDLLGLRPPPDALFVTNNLMTVGALQALADRGVEVPGQMILASFDELYWTTLIRPRLTTVAQPAYEMGTIAGQPLAERIAGYQGPGQEARPRGNAPRARQLPAAG